jgi:hypothetical protein
VSSLPARLRRQVVHRARGRCEYCGLAQERQDLTFHLDHIIPRSVGGELSIDNLALACASCSVRKQARRSAKDQETGRVVRLFHPRQQRWADHFQWDGVLIHGLTPSGRQTVSTLHMNRELIRAIRAEETARGRHPPRC